MFLYDVALARRLPRLTYLSPILTLLPLPVGLAWNVLPDAVLLPEEAEPLTEAEVFRSVAIFRLLNPTAWIRMAAGRRRFAGGGRKLFRCGANAAITGDMLTTTGTGIAGDRAMLAQLGYEI